MSLQSMMKAETEHAQEKGIQIGIKQGIEKGARSTQLSICRKMLEKHMDPEAIQEMTGLSLEDIHKVQSEGTLS